MALATTLTALALAAGVGIGSFAAPSDAADPVDTGAGPASHGPAMHGDAGTTPAHMRRMHQHMRACEARRAQDDMRRQMESPRMRAMHERMMGEGHAMGAR